MHEYMYIYIDKYIHQIGENVPRHSSTGARDSQSHRCTDKAELSTPHMPLLIYKIKNTLIMINNK